MPKKLKPIKKPDDLRPIRLNLRIQPGIADELYHEMIGIVPGGRGERLRHLAAVGIVALGSASAGKKQIKAR